MQRADVPAIRVQAVNQAPVRESGDYVLYWMIAQRRVTWNFSLERAVEWSLELGKPLVVLEALRCGYRWASHRLHRFIIDGMADNATRLAKRRALYYPYVESEEGEGAGLLGALAERAAVVVTDDFPCFFLPRMVAAAGKALPVRLEQVDSNGLLPVAAADKVYLRAVDFRRHLQKTLAPHLEELPKADPLARQRIPVLEKLPEEITSRWPVADLNSLRQPDGLDSLPIDPSVPVVDYSGGSAAAELVLERFLEQRLPRYAEERNAVSKRATSELSPYLHFGHLSAHQIFAAAVAREDWNPGQLFHKATAARRGWWGLSESLESFLDELVTWRELGYNMTSRWSNYDQYESLPAWARASLEEHLSDPRPQIYELETFDRAATHDELWNAAQRELRRDGRIHNYLRMVWGKKILEWTPDPRTALAVMIELNNKWAIDGRNPNSYSGIFWCLGRYDRAWGPERPIFGKIRFMSLANTRRKLDAKSYLATYGAQGELFA